MRPAACWSSSPPTPASPSTCRPFAEDLYFDKMEQTVRAADGSADVYFLPMDSTAFTQWNADAIEPITPYLEDPSKTSPDYDFADFPEGFMGGVTYPPGDPAAQVYGIPIAFEAYTLFYNKDHVDKYLDGAVPETMPELIAAAARSPRKAPRRASPVRSCEASARTPSWTR